MKHFEIVNMNTGEVVMRVEALTTVHETKNGVDTINFVGDTNVSILHMPAWNNYRVVEKK